VNNVVLIPTSRLVDAEMQLEVGRIPPALIPLRGKPLYLSILEKYSQLPGTTQTIFAASEGKELLQASLTLSGIKNAELIQIPSLPDLGAAILHTLEQVNLAACDNLFINFGDTLVDASIECDADTIFYDDLRESFRWTSFEEKAAKITKITDKGIVDDSTQRHVFCGVFLIKKPQEFLACLSQVRTSDKIGRFYAALQLYLDGRPYRLQKVDEWHDFGHVDNYYHERKKSLNKRFFNQLSVDANRPIIIKKSEQVEKFAGEIQWYLDLPPALKPYIPQVFDYALAGRDSYVQMEFYGYPTVGELLLSGGHSLGIWNHVFDAIFRVMRDMQAHRHFPEASYIASAVKDMYVNKTSDRLDRLRQHPVLGKFFSRDIIVNKRHYPCLNEILDDLRSNWQRLIPSARYLSIIHGDFCASNILFDPRSRIIKLIDARGKFGDSAMYGDYRYDLAKLSHSFNGCYEMIVNDSFFAVCEDNAISYTINSSAYQNSVADMFNHRMSSEYSQDREAVRLVESILFLSMLPLHSDYLNRQIVMLATGVEKYTLAAHPLEARA
jgi:hypothetical protein